ncbi:MAG: phosphoribosylanthranilate isomerase [Acidobacteriota bacterium]
MTRTRVKICGVTDPEEAELAVRLGADYLGLNFHPPSPRYVQPDDARAIADAVRGRTEIVGVFVDRPIQWVEEVATTVGLDRIQLHGDEPAATVAHFGERALKVVRIESAFDATELEGFDTAWGFLFDTRHPTLWGGTGEGWDYRSVAGEGLDRPYFIAGGLSPDNIAEAIEGARPWGVDICSGVEAEPGRKDPARLERLFAEIDTTVISS